MAVTGMVSVLAAVIAASGLWLAIDFSRSGSVEKTLTQLDRLKQRLHGPPKEATSTTRLLIHGLYYEEIIEPPITIVHAQASQNGAHGEKDECALLEASIAHEEGSHSYERHPGSGEHRQEGDASGPVTLVGLGLYGEIAVASILTLSSLCVAFVVVMYNQRKRAQKRLRTQIGVQPTSEDPTEDPTRLGGNGGLLAVGTTLSDGQVQGRGKGLPTFKGAVKVVQAKNRLQRLAEARHETEEKLEHSVVQISMAGLLIIDIACMIVEMVVDLDHTLIAAQGHDADEVRVVMHEASMIILFVFLAENCLMMFALGPSAFCRTPGFMLDLLVITASLAAVLFYPETAGVQTLFLLRLWRIPRIMNAFYVAHVKEQEAVQLHYVREMEWRLEKLRVVEHLLPPLVVTHAYAQVEHDQRVKSLASRPKGMARARRDLHRFLESFRVQISLVTLLLIDMGCVTMGLVVAHNPCLAFSSVHHADIALWVLDEVSVGVLFVFEAEILGLLFALGPKRFLCNVGTLFDMSVINLSLYAELCMAEGDNKQLLVVLRIWRVLRLVQALYMINHKRMQAMKDRYQTKIDEKTLVLQLLRCYQTEMQDGRPVPGSDGRPPTESQPPGVDSSQCLQSTLLSRPVANEMRVINADGTTATKPVTDSYDTVELLETFNTLATNYRA